MFPIAFILVVGVIAIAVVIVMLVGGIGAVSRGPDPDEGSRDVG